MNRKTVQARLGVKQDGNWGPVTYTAMLSYVAARTVDQAHGAALAAHGPAYGVDATVRRLAALIGQCCHESLRFTRTREIWGPTADQLAYDKPGNSLGNLPGDGFKMRGAGPIEVTGRRNLTVIGTRIGRNLTADPAILDDIDIGWLISLEWWKMNNMNTLADTRDSTAVSRAVNLGNPDSKRTPYGLSDRIAYTNRATGLLS